MCARSVALSLLPVLPLVRAGTLLWPRADAADGAAIEYAGIYGAASANATWFPPVSGRATVTHYGFPRGALGSCGCARNADKYPTAALNSLALGSSTSFGPGCGLCARVTLQSTPESAPPPAGDGHFFSPAQVQDGTAPSIVVKVTDQCPWSGPQGGAGSPCNATSTKPNRWGASVHFDLAWPAPDPSSKAIPSNWFPGDHDYGTWLAEFAWVSCTQWAGSQDEMATGSDWALEDAGCCPADPPLPGTPSYGRLVHAGQPQPEPKPATCPSAQLAKSWPSALVPNTSNENTKGQQAPDAASSSAASRISAATVQAVAGLALLTSFVVAVVTSL